MRVRTLALGAILGASAAGGANAQQTPEIPQLTFERQFDLEGRVAVFHDSNIARTSRATARARGVKPEDVTITPAIAASIVQPLGRQMLFLEGSAGYDFHLENEQLDRRRYEILAGGSAAVGPCRPVVYGTFRALQSDLADLDLGTTENLQKANGVAAGVECGRGIGFGASTVAQRIDTKNSAASMIVQDHTAESLGVILTYNNPTLANVAIIWSYANNEFPNRVIPDRPIGDGFWTQSIGLRVERRLGSRLNVGGTASRTRLKREFAPGGQDLKLSATTYQADISYRAGSRLLLELTGAREVRPSDRPGKLYDIAEGLEGRGRYRLNSRFAVTVGHIYQEVASNVDTAVARAVVTNSRSNTTYGTVEFTGLRRAVVQLDVRREDRDTNLPIFNYISTRVGLTTSVSF